MTSATILQQAVAGVLNDPAVEHEVAERSALLGERGRRFLAELLTLNGFRSPVGPPMGGFYVFVDVAELYQTLRSVMPEMPSIGEAVAQYLLERCGVAVTPGCAFGTMGESYIRISFAVPDADLQTALRRIEQIVGRRR
jgi:aspartate/methionine/tyrosine aminotransferase